MLNGSELFWKGGVLLGSTKSQIVNAIGQCETEILDFTKKLVSLPTENPPGRNYQECVEVIAEKLAQIGLEYQIIEVPNQQSGSNDRHFPRHCLLSHFGTGRKTLYFHGHYDVVPAFKPEQFNPCLREGSLFGRGASDMKSGLAAMIYAVKAIKMCNLKLNGRIGLTLVPDEETGGVLGSKYLSQIGMLGKDGIGMLLPEPTSRVVWNANRGAISLKITVKGKAAHVGHQYQGINAFEKMLFVANEFQKIKNKVETRETDYNIQPSEARNSILMLGGLCHGGSGFNVVPEEVFFTVDRRINPEENLETEKQRLLDCLKYIKKQGIDVDVEILQEGTSSSISENSPLAQALSKNITGIMGKAPAFEMCPGLLEIRFYGEKGLPALAYGPGILECSHGPEEFVKVKNIYHCAAIYALTAIDLLSD